MAPPAMPPTTAPIAAPSHPPAIAPIPAPTPAPPHPREIAAQEHPGRDAILHSRVHLDEPPVGVHRDHVLVTERVGVVAEDETIETERREASHHPPAKAAVSPPVVVRDDRLRVEERPVAFALARPGRGEAGEVTQDRGTVILGIDVTGVREQPGPDERRDRQTAQEAPEFAV